MKDGLLRDFDIFKQLLVKGSIFVYKSYSFGENTPLKARPLIILNSSPPQNKESPIFYSTLSGSNIERYIENKPKGIVVLRDDNLRCPSAFNLKQIIPENSGKFHNDYLENALFHPGLLSDENIKYVHAEICKFVSDERMKKTISKVIRKAIHQE